MGKEKLEDT